MFDILPKVVVNDLLADWLTLSCVGRLDSALCVHDQRSRFLPYLQATSYGKNLPMSLYCESDIFLNWILQRKVKLHVTELTLNRNLINNSKLRCEVLASFGKELNKVGIDADINADVTWLDRTVTDVALHCTNLKDCNFNRFSDSTVATVLARNPNMERVSLHKCVSERKTEILHLVGILCPRIRTIDMRSNAEGRSFGSFLSAIPRTLQCLCLPNCSGFTWATFLNILQQCTELRELRVHTLGVNYDKPPNVLPCKGLFGMRTFRGDFYHLNERTIAVLGELMPHLTTLIILTSRMNEFRPDECRGFFRSILEKFVYLRRLVFALPCEEMLKPLPDCAALEDVTSDKPLPGSLLEELYVTDAAACLSVMPLPALKVLGCKNDTSLPALPPQVKKMVLLRDTRIRTNHEAIFLQLNGLDEIYAVFSHGLSEKWPSRTPTCKSCV